MQRASERRLVEGETCSSEGEACPGVLVVSRGKFASRTGTWRGAMGFVESWWACSKRVVVVEGFIIATLKFLDCVR